MYEGIKKRDHLQLGLYAPSQVDWLATESSLNMTP